MVAERDSPTLLGSVTGCIPVCNIENMENVNIVNFMMHLYFLFSFVVIYIDDIFTFLCFSLLCLFSLHFEMVDFLYGI